MASIKIVRGPEFRVPARIDKNVIEWTTMIVPSGFTKDTWVTSMSARVRAAADRLSAPPVGPEAASSASLVRDFRRQREVRDPLHVDAHYNNAMSNKFNPNPNQTVYIGRMTWEEMMAPFFDILVDTAVNQGTVLKRGQFVLDSGA